MRVRILTFHNANNYGAVLQTYALQKVVSQLGVAVEVLNYRNEKIENSYKIFRRGSVKNIKVFLAFLAYLPSKLNKKMKFNLFRYRYLHQVKFSPKNLESTLETDCYIVGSDQVWNYLITECDTTYLLDFVKCGTKNSYAASFGVSEIPPKLVETYKRYLSIFNNISIRETELQNLTENLTKIKVDVHLDPTFLLNKAEWTKIPKKKIKKDYILVFEMTRSSNLSRIAHLLSEKEDLEIIYISDFFWRKKKCKNLRSVSPVKWIAYISSAKYVLTNSFHGTAFAINLNRTFYTELMPDSTKSNARLTSLLKIFGLEGRLIDSNTIVELDKPINWFAVNARLSLERARSHEYLARIIDETKNR